MGNSYNYLEARVCISISLYLVLNYKLDREQLLRIGHLKVIEDKEINSIQALMLSKLRVEQMPSCFTFFRSSTNHVVPRLRPKEEHKPKSLLTILLPHPQNVFYKETKSFPEEELDIKRRGGKPWGHGETTSPTVKIKMPDHVVGRVAGGGGE